jgi:hypothetical protein
VVHFVDPSVLVACNVACVFEYEIVLKNAYTRADCITGNEVTILSEVEVRYFSHVGMFQDSCRLDRLVTLHHWV